MAGGRIVESEGANNILGTSENGYDRKLDTDIQKSPKKLHNFKKYQKG